MILVAFVLQVIFFVLKITGAVHWTWPVVLVPLWVVLVAGLVNLVLCVLADVFEELARRHRRKVRGW